MNRSLGLLLASTVAASLVGACTAGTDSTELGVGGTHGAGSSGSGMTSSGSGTTSSGGGTTSSSGAGSSSGTTTASSSGTAPPPDAGPGSVGSQAHQFFNSTVYPELVSTCTACHASGASGAPEMMQPPADTTYSELDAMGLIQANSLLLSKGSHDNGSAPALTSQETADITSWLNMEANEASGSTSTAPNVLAEIGACVSMTDWQNIKWGDLKTQPRTGENENKCSGCAYAQCASCHASGTDGFFMDEGTPFDPTGSIAYQETFQGPSLNSYIIQFFGLNGTTPIASNAIATWQTSVAAMPDYGVHPMFVVPADMNTAINTMVTDAITAYTNHTCGSLDGGTADAGP